MRREGGKEKIDRGRGAGKDRGECDEIERFLTGRDNGERGGEKGKGEGRAGASRDEMWKDEKSVIEKGRLCERSKGIY
jgi:hypothetical protein